MINTITYSNYKFDIEPKQNQVYIKAFDTVTMELYEGTVYEHEIYVSPINKFCTMLSSALGQEKDFTIGIVRCPDKLKCELKYKTNFIELDEAFSLDQVANTQAIEHFLKNKITELEKRVESFETKLLDNEKQHKQKISELEAQIDKPIVFANGWICTSSSGEYYGNGVFDPARQPTFYEFKCLPSSEYLDWTKCYGLRLLGNYLDLNKLTKLKHINIYQIQLRMYRNDTIEPKFCLNEPFDNNTCIYLPNVTEITINYHSMVEICTPRIPNHDVIAPFYNSFPNIKTIRIKDFKNNNCSILEAITPYTLRAKFINVECVNCTQIPPPHLDEMKRNRYITLTIK